MRGWAGEIARSCRLTEGTQYWHIVVQYLIGGTAA